MTVPAGPPKAAFWNDRGARGIAAQAAAMAIVVAIGWYLIDNTLDNLAGLHIATGFGFLEQSANFAIGESFIPYESTDSYARVITAGLVNTLVASAIGILVATAIGVVVGITRLSKNWLLAKIATVYVETLRNLPLVLQLFVWYEVIGSAFPLPRQAWRPIVGVYISNRGIQAPKVIVDNTIIAIGVALALAILASVIWARGARRHQMQTGQARPVLWPSLGAILGLPLLAFVATGAQIGFDMPELRGFNFAGGSTLTPEMSALVIGLSLYTSTYIAEVVRAGILAVPKGQSEAARALGLSEGRIMRLIVLPQALRVIIPPLISQYLNLIKNSSLATVVGYPDLVHVINTAINQTNQAIESIAIMMAAYLTVSLSVSALLNWFNARVRLVER
jgi:general L-amino acid transport system permease protein